MDEWRSEGEGGLDFGGSGHAKIVRANDSSSADLARGIFARMILPPEISIKITQNLTSKFARLWRRRGALVRFQGL